MFFFHFLSFTDADHAQPFKKSSWPLATCVNLQSLNNHCIGNIINIHNDLRWCWMECAKIDVVHVANVLEDSLNYILKCFVWHFCVNNFDCCELLPLTCLHGSTRYLTMIRIPASHTNTIHGQSVNGFLVDFRTWFVATSPWSTSVKRLVRGFGRGSLRRRPCSASLLCWWWGCGNPETHF